MTTAIHIRTDWVALLLGLVIAAAFLMSWRVEGGGAVAPAKLELSAAPSNDIAIGPSGMAPQTRRISPSLAEDGVRHILGLRNATAAPLSVGLKATTDQPDVARVVQVEVRAGALPVYTGSLEGLATGSKDTFPLQAGQEVDLTLNAWIPTDAPSEIWSGRSVVVYLELLTEGA